MKKILFVLTFALIAALALSACEPADDAALTDAERTATAEAQFGVEPTPGLEDPAAPADPGVEPVDPAPVDPDPIDPPADPEVELTPTPDAVAEPETTPTPDTVEVDEEERAEIYRLSYVIDWDVRDQQGEDVGDVHSFVVDQQTGYIHYVLLNPDGDLEIDGDVVAVPWNALSVSHLDRTMVGVVDNDNDAVQQTPENDAQETPVAGDNDNDTFVMNDDDPHFVLTVDRQVLVNAPAIEDVDDFFTESPQFQDFAGYWEGQLAGVPVTGDMEAEVGELQNPLHLDDVTGYDIYNPEGDQIADVAEMIVDPETGLITHIVASVGGFLGLGERYVPIPFLAFEYDQEEERFILQATEEELENAPGYDALDDIQYTQPNWDDEYNQYWGVEPGEGLPGTGPDNGEQNNEEATPAP